MIMGGALVFPLHLLSERFFLLPLPLQISASSDRFSFIHCGARGRPAGRELRPLLRFIKYLAEDERASGPATKGRCVYAKEEIRQPSVSVKCGDFYDSLAGLGKHAAVAHKRTFTAEAAKYDRLYGATARDALQIKKKNARRPFDK